MEIIVLRLWGCKASTLCNEVNLDSFLFLTKTFIFIDKCMYLPQSYRHTQKLESVWVETDYPITMFWILGENPGKREIFRTFMHAMFLKVGFIMMHIYFFKNSKFMNNKFNSLHRYQVTWLKVLKANSLQIASLAVTSIHPKDCSCCRVCVLSSGVRR